MDVTAQAWATYFLLFIRFTALIAIMPVFNWRGIPALAKVGFAAIFAYLVYLAALPAAVEAPNHIFSFFLTAVSEALLGLVMGFFVLLYFTAVRIAGELIDFQAGLMAASIFDPQYGSQVTIFGHFYYLFALVFYLSINGHHHLFMALAKSVSLIPPGGVVMKASAVPTLTHFFWQMFIIAFQLAVPVVTVMIFCDLALGLLAKTVPQLNVFMEGMPLKVGVGLFIVYLVFPYFAQVLEVVFGGMHQNLSLLLGLF